MSTTAYFFKTIKYSIISSLEQRSQHQNANFSCLGKNYKNSFEKYARAFVTVRPILGPNLILMGNERSLLEWSTKMSSSWLRSSFT
jgi:hypothetical protein